MPVEIDNMLENYAIYRSAVLSQPYKQNPE
jgi:hypothetical protein